MRRGHSLAIYAALALAAVASRLPFMFGTGLGTDPDAWRLYLAGSVARETGTYAASRAPGYPLLEHLAYLLVGAPWWVFAALTTLVTAAGVIAVASLARHLGVRAWPAVALGVAFTNVVWRGSTSYMDYNWSFALLFCSLAFLAKRRLLVAGVLLGLALACRPATVIAAIVIVVLFAADRSWSARRIVAVVAPAAVVVAAFFAVPVATYGRALLRPAGTDATLPQVVSQAVVGVWGPYGAVFVFAALILALVRVAKAGRLPAEAAWMLALAASTAVQFGAFLLLPADAGYLTPAVAMIWLLLGMALSRAQVGVLAAAVAMGALVPAPIGTSVIQDAGVRRQVIAQAGAEVAAIRALPAGSVVVAGDQLPRLVTMAGASAPAGSDTAGGRSRATLTSGQVLVYELGHGLAEPEETFTLGALPATPRE